MLNKKGDIVTIRLSLSVLQLGVVIKINKPVCLHHKRTIFSVSLHLTPDDTSSCSPVAMNACTSTMNAQCTLDFLFICMLGNCHV